MPHVVLVTGAGHHLGLRVAAALAADPGIERIIGIDSVAPSARERTLLGRTEFVRADIGHPLLATVLAQGRVDTVVHAALAAPQRTLGGRRAGHDNHVLGAMQLLAACQKSDTVRRLVLRSTTAVYGGSRTAPAVFTEREVPPRPLRRVLPRAAADVESYARGLVRRRPDITVCVARLAEVLGPDVDTPLARYLAGPVVPVPLGRDPRLQFLHVDDAVEALRLAAGGERTGVVNVAGPGALVLSQAVRRAGRVRVPVPPRGLAAAGALLGNPATAELLAQDPVLLDTGRVVDVGVLRRDFGFVPARTSAQALESFVASGRALSRSSGHRSGVGSRVAERAGPGVGTSGPWWRDLAGLGRT